MAVGKAVRVAKTSAAQQKIRPNIAALPQEYRSSLAAGCVDFIQGNGADVKIGTPRRRDRCAVLHRQQTGPSLPWWHGEEREDQWFQCAGISSIGRTREEDRGISA